MEIQILCSGRLHALFMATRCAVKSSSRVIRTKIGFSVYDGTYLCNYIW